MDKFLSVFEEEKKEKRVTEVIKGEEGLKGSKVLIGFEGKKSVE